jgi:lactoylglutathione lyase
LFTSLRGILYRVPNLDTAKQWYQKVLGKPPIFDSPMVVVFTIGDVLLNLTPAEGTSPTREPQAIAYWGVQDIEAAHRQLLEAGATAPWRDLHHGPQIAGGDPGGSVWQHVRHHQQAVNG